MKSNRGDTMNKKKTRKIPDNIKELMFWGAVLGGVLLAGFLIAFAIVQAINLLIVVTLPEDKPAEGVARVTAFVRYLDAPEDVREWHTIEEYREGDSPVPEWYNPEEPMAAEWEENLLSANSQPSFSEVRDAGCPDWNLDTTIWGWDGRRAEVWELDLLGRIFYLEFWGSSDMLCEAGIDAILRLWESGDHGRTLGEVLSAVNERGDFVFSTYPEVWSTEYDADGLAWCRAYTVERFIAGPVWIAPYFRLDHYHDTKWSVPAYQIDNVFFSVGKEW